MKVNHIVGKVRGIFLLDSLKIVNNHFVDNSLFFIQVYQDCISEVLPWLNKFCVSLVVQTHKMNLKIFFLSSIS